MLWDDSSPESPELVSFVYSSFAPIRDESTLIAHVRLSEPHLTGRTQAVPGAGRLYLEYLIRSDGSGFTLGVP